MGREGGGRMRQRSRVVESRTASEPAGATGAARSSRVRTPPRVTVVGSLNTDISLAVPHLPGPGETVLSPAGAVIGAGGKGANQAVAAARLGAAAGLLAGGVDWLVVNEQEAAAVLGRPLAGPQEAPAAASALARMGAGNVVITLGAAGAVLARAPDTAGPEMAGAPDAPGPDVAGAPGAPGPDVA